MRKIVLFCMFLFLSHISFAQDQAFKKDIEKFNDLTGFTSKIELVKTTVLAALSEEGKIRFSKEFDAAFNEFKDKSAFLFSQYYTHDQFKATIKDFEETQIITLPEIEKGEEFSKAFQKLNEEFSVAVQKAYLKEQ